MKKFMSTILILCVLSLASVTFAATYSKPAKVMLSSLSEEACVKYLASMGVTVPEAIAEVDVLGMVADIEADPTFDRSMTIGYTVLADFMRDVRTVVLRYYGWDEGHALGSPYVTNSTKYSLKNSTFIEWASDMANYNCYAYVLGRTSHAIPGDFSSGEYDDDADISVLANLVKADLQDELGYSCVKVQTARPTSSTGWQNAIAVRKDTTKDVNNVNDFHFAMLTPTGWRHKPSFTAVLQFKGIAELNDDWTNECYIDGVAVKPSVTYESDMYFLLYKASHRAVGTPIWIGNHYHSGNQHYYQVRHTCADCGGPVYSWEVYACDGPPCDMLYSVPVQVELM